MKRTEWLMRLENELDRMKVSNPKEIFADYEEHFTIGASQGKTEEEIATKLGDPQAAARAHQAETLVTKAAGGEKGPQVKNVFNATMRVLMLTPFNFFMLIGPFLAVAIFLFSGWMVCVAFAGVSAALIGVSFLSLPFLVSYFAAVGAVIFAALAFCGITILSVLTMILITQWILTLFVSYMRWNVDFVLQKQ